MLLVSVRIGGFVVGAYDQGRLVGFAYALPGIRDGKPFQWSHMLGVVPEYRASGLGWRLKAEQRRLVMASGVDLIAWTYDPLQAANAHLNFAKLGTVAREYHLDDYPGSSSPLHAGTPTDRLIAEWWLRSDRVVERLAAVARREPPHQRSASVAAGGAASQRRAGVGASEAILVNRVREAGEWLAPDGHDLSLDAPHLALTIPTGFTDLQQRDLPMAQSWRGATRELFTAYLARGYQVTDFLLDLPRRRGTYLLFRA
jgi:predicted GNAT superfamily acetyltransferase